MAREFLGRGWRFPILPDTTGSLCYVEGDEDIEQSLKLVLLTRRGERPMRPDFGSEAPRLLFSPGSHQYLRLLENSIREAVRDWEPRVELLSVLAELPAGQDNHAQVQISYRVRRNNNKRNLVFPYYLDVSEGG